MIILKGTIWPAMSSLFVYWTPGNERTKMIGVATTGAWVGNVIALPLGGILCVNGFGGGWPSIFYIFGIVSILWSLAFLYLISDTPQKHRFITREEAEYIIQTTKKEVSARQGRILVRKNSL